MGGLTIKAQSMLEDAENRNKTYDDFILRPLIKLQFKIRSPSYYTYIDLPE